MSGHDKHLGGLQLQVLPQPEWPALYCPMLATGQYIQWNLFSGTLENVDTCIIHIVNIGCCYAFSLSVEASAEQQYKPLTTVSMLA